jgi:hypothetical protein
MDMSDKPEFGKPPQRGPARPTLPEPVEIAKFWKNRRHDAVVVTLETFKDRNVVNVRQHVMDKTGKLVPTSKGITLVILRLPELSAAIAKALAKAKELNLLDGADEAAE